MPPSKPEIDPPVHTETNGNETNDSVKNDTDDMVLDDDQEEEEDKVVREIDVFFTSNHANSKLYVLSYPLRPHWRSYELDDRRLESETGDC
ncbi:putative DNA-directed RNA polymerase III subunit Rpc5 [Helianthus annuus]|nr:putative DNA-directed RNA polymerase III subunit Rpc5 [Helianthus annuus]